LYFREVVFFHSITNFSSMIIFLFILNHLGCV
jgi:hypothetical protein